MRARFVHCARLLSGIVATTLAGVIAGACSGSTTHSSGGDGGNGASSSGSHGGSSGTASSSGAASSSGGSSSGAGSSGGSSSGIVFGEACAGCCNPASQSYTVNPAVCEPQLLQANSCDGYVCMWTVEVPCAGDAGAGDGGTDGGTGMPCDAWCKAATPPGVTAASCQFMTPLDGGGGAIAQCGVCGL